MNRRRATVIFAAALGLAAIACSLGGRTRDEAPSSGEATATVVIIVPTQSLDQPTDQAESVDFTVTGEVTAEVQGQVDTWRLFEVTSVAEGRGNMATWSRDLNPLDPSQLQYSVDFAAADVTDPNGTATSQWLIQFSFMPEQDQGTIALGSSGGDLYAEISYQDLTGDQPLFYQMDQGDLTFDILHAEPGQPAAVEGTFAGTLTLASEDADSSAPASLDVSKGSFQIEKASFVDVDED